MMAAAPGRTEDALLIAPGFDRRANLRLWGAFCLGLVGIAGSFATIYASPEQKAAVLPCGVKMLACSTALSTSISHVAGIPLGVFGVLYFMFWTLNLREFHRTGQDEYQTALTWGTGLGALVSLSLATYMFAVLRSPCLYCLVTHSSNLGALALLWPYRRFRLPDFTTNEVWHFVAMTAIAILAASTTYFANAHRIALAQIARLSQGEATVVDMPAEEGVFHAIKDIPDALARARKEGRYVLVFVYHPSCGGCREFKRHVYHTKAFSDFAAARLVQVVINARDADLSDFGRLPVTLSRKIEPSLYPTLSLIAPDSRVVFFDEGLGDFLDATPARFIDVLQGKMGSPTGATGAPAWTVKALDGGQEVSVGRSKVTVVDFFATWCAPCGKSFPAMQALYAKYQPRGLQIIALSSDEEAAAILAFARRHTVTFPVSLDADGTLAGRMKVTTMPTTFVFDARGAERFRHDGYEEGDQAVLEQTIQKLLAEP